MNMLQDWAVGLCLTAIGLSIIKLLLPAGRVREGVSVLTAVCFFCCLIEPLAAIGELGSLLIDTKNTETAVCEELTALTDEQIDTVLTDALCRDAEMRLEGYDVEILHVQIERDIHDVDGIYIKRVVLTTKGKRLPREVYKKLELAWGVQVEVTEDGGW